MDEPGPSGRGEGDIVRILPCCMTLNPIMLFAEDVAQVCAAYARLLELGCEDAPVALPGFFVAARAGDGLQLRRAVQYEPAAEAGGEARVHVEGSGMHRLSELANEPLTAQQWRQAEAEACYRALRGEGAPLLLAEVRTTTETLVHLHRASTILRRVEGGGKAAEGDSLDALIAELQEELNSQALSDAEWSQWRAVLQKWVWSDEAAYNIACSGGYRLAQQQQQQQKKKQHAAGDLPPPPPRPPTNAAHAFASRTGLAVAVVAPSNGGGGEGRGVVKPAREEEEDDEEEERVAQRAAAPAPSPRAKAQEPPLSARGSGQLGHLSPRDSSRQRSATPAGAHVQPELTHRDLGRDSRRRRSRSPGRQRKSSRSPEQRLRKSSRSPSPPRQRRPSRSPDGKRRRADAPAEAARPPPAPPGFSQREWAWALSVHALIIRNPDGRCAMTELPIRIPKDELLRTRKSAAAYVKRFDTLWRVDPFSPQMTLVALELPPAPDTGRAGERAGEPRRDGGAQREEPSPRGRSEQRREQERDRGGRRDGDRERERERERT